MKQLDSSIVVLDAECKMAWSAVVPSDRLEVYVNQIQGMLPMIFEKDKDNYPLTINVLEGVTLEGSKWSK